MGEKHLKPGWKMWRFDEIVENIGERAYPTPDDSERYIGLEHLDTGCLRVRRWGSKTDLVGQKLRMRKGDILFARRNAYLKRVAIAPHDGLFSAHGMVLRAKTAAVHSEFLPFFMQSDLFMNRAVEISVGSLSPTINWKAIASQEFALPPIESQQSLADLGHAHQGCADSYWRLVQSTASLLLARTQALFNPDVLGASRSSKVGDIGDVQYGLTVNAKRKTAKQFLPYLRVANVQRFRIDLSEVKQLGVEPKDSCCLLRQHDILVIEGHADIHELGRAAIWEGQIPVCSHQNHLMRIRCHEDAIAHYVLEYINSPAGRAYFRQQGKSTSGLNTLNSKVLRDMPIPMPNLHEQELIASELRAGRLALEAASRRHQRAVALGRMALNRSLGVE